MTDKELADKAAKILGQHAPFFASEWKAPEFVYADRNVVIRRTNLKITLP